VCARHARATSLPGCTFVASRCVVELLDVVHSRRGGMPATELGERGRVAAAAGWAVTAEDGSHGGAGRDTPRRLLWTTLAASTGSVEWLTDMSASR